MSVLSGIAPPPSPASPSLQTENRETGVLAALKRVPIQDETELEDFMVEIDILTECKHRNIVGLYQAFFHDSALWVRQHSASLILYCIEVMDLEMMKRLHQSNDTLFLLCCHEYCVCIMMSPPCHLIPAYSV